MKGYYIHICIRNCETRAVTNDEHSSDKSTLPKYRPKKAREHADVTSVRSPLFKHRPLDFLSLSLSPFNEVAPGQQPDFSTRKTRSHGAPQSNRVETRDQTFVIRTDTAEMSTGTINAAPRCNACPTGTMGIPSD